jgi:hypothetical protein
MSGRSAYSLIDQKKKTYGPAQPVTGIALPGNKKIYYSKKKDKIFYQVFWRLKIISIRNLNNKIQKRVSLFLIVIASKSLRVKTKNPERI